MIDLHFHCLPGIDDGPETWDQAVALCRAAAAEGTAAVVATPHVLRDPWMNEDVKVRDGLVAHLNALLLGEPVVLAGCEYFFSSGAMELVEKGATGPLVGLNRGKYLLLEFGRTVPPDASAIFHEMSLLGTIPVIAHPERHPTFVRNPERLKDLVDRGALVQVTAGCVIGEFGTKAQEATEELLRLGLVHVVASDAHSMAARPPRLALARERIRRDHGAEAAARLFETNPAAIAASEPLSWNDQQ
ncbi:MAG: CpsB/CapC family capsule biosynthesis tyrosine phosphatase [Acidobacteriota bacterium]